MKKLLLILIAAFFMMVFGGCYFKIDKTQKNLDYIKSLKSYTSDAHIILQNDKQNIEYDMKQYYKKNMGVRLELNSDRIYVCKGDKIYVNDIKSGFKYTLSGDFENIVKLSSVGEYIRLIYTNEEIKTYFKDISGIKYQVLEIYLSNLNRNLDKGKLYINNETKLPEFVEVYDLNNKIKFKVLYKNFVANAEVNEELLSTEAKGGI
ncbi:germination lipoprotein GerS-related protein [Clostridium peptidivorans]|uniref:germination lipoprotein GerS-related protein n=1 Tax=Clostridium peptidivorans TaxID=100174 RepID=UPI000BE391D8|nr:germination lipoprotein GerS-related protein [Clostridium peptidivorans]